MKLVAVSQRVDVYPDRNERRDALDQRLGAFLLAAGFMPVPIPNSFFTESPESAPFQGYLGAWLETINPCALMLSGGNDIGTCRERDRTESWLLDYAKESDLPVLGICRGMQMMGAWAGTGLKPATGHVCARHRLVGEISGEANSYHDLSLTECPTGFRPIAESDDHEIEAIRHQKLPFEGWMWHPERERTFNIRDIQRMKALFRA